MANTKHFFYFVILFIILSLCSKGQEINLSANLKIQFKDGKLENAIQSISDKTGIHFAYRNSLLDDITVSNKNYDAPLDSIISDLLNPYKLCYSIQNKQIIIHRNCISATYKISGTVYEAETNQPLPYASVYIAGKPNNTIADHIGYYEFETALSATDTIIFSTMGYERDTLIVFSTKAEGLVTTMKKKIYEIEPLVIRPIEYFSEKVGNDRDREAGSLYIDTHGQQTAIFVKNKKSQIGRITSVEYYLSSEGNTDAPFRVRIYEADSSGKPGRDLIQDAIVVKPQIAEGWYSIDISELRIDLPLSGAFVAIEGVFPEDFKDYYGSSEFIDLGKQVEKDPSIQLTYGQRIGYNRKCRQDTWHYSMSKVWFQLNKQSFGVMITAVVKYEKLKQNSKTDNHEIHTY